MIKESKRQKISGKKVGGNREMRGGSLDLSLHRQCFYSFMRKWFAVGLTESEAGFALVYNVPSDRLGESNHRSYQRRRNYAKGRRRKCSASRRQPNRALGAYECTRKEC